ncbi:Inner membrane protein YrbG [Posidoniimonas polymericola]|uniref:Inner membrane protein YrbG n=1 Tax=Posidoniimonas polymericola TaxID=2528002 RepID=A0A5C5YC70_9BACT|nr:calcium/sodium antiporter [Posidoniimonas polymericola]TWT72704.1 Inner membrane protein YrbG [Posidoniimonas polymericola]
MTIAVLIILGLVGLVAGGELLVRGASSLAAAASVSPLVIGLTVVAFGTSAPELAVSVQACFTGSTDLAIGNAVGSNVANILLILGFSAIFFPLAVQARLFRLDFPVMLAAAIALWVLGRDGALGRVDGAILTVGMLAYFFWTVGMGRKEGRQLAEEFADVVPEGDPTTLSSIVVSVVQVLIGLLLLVGGSNLLVDGCVRLATMFGVSELVVGLTVVAIGTSMPELVTSVVAARRGHRDLAVGNVVGSNILNIFAVLGLSSIVAPAGVEVQSRALAFDIPVMIAISFACLPVFLSGHSITRTEGAVMFLLFVGYTGYLVWASVNGVSPGWFEAACFSVPILVGACAVGLLGSRRKPS